MARHFLIVFLFMGFILTRLYAQPLRDWLTFYEKSDYQETPRYAETVAFCQRLDSASRWLKYTSFGTSPQGRPLPLVIVDRNGHFTPEAVKRSGNIVVLILCGIHAGEIDGKDASLMLMRDLVIHKKVTHILDHTTLLLIPIFNVDGHERFGRYNRINQNGPEEMGWRTTAQNLNLNRDFLKAESPEMQAWLKMFNTWLPDLLVDCHVTDGADYQYVLTYDLERYPNFAEPLVQWENKVLEPYLNSQMKLNGFPVFPFFWLKDRHDVQKGIVGTVFSPRYSTGYGAVQNRIFLLIETHMLKSYRVRVTATFHFLRHLLEIVNQKYQSLKEAIRLAEEQTANLLVGKYFPLQLTPDMNKYSLIDFLGKEYHITRSEISGGEWVQYGKNPKRYRLPWFNKIRVTDSVRIPYAYLIPREWRFQIDKLKLHGVQIDVLAKDTTLLVESYRFGNVHWRHQPFEGHHLVDYDVEEIQEERFYPAGTAVVLMNQRTNRLIAHLLEPQGPDSFVRWGLWDVIFERKEYAEDYILEKMAREMLESNPSLKREFQNKIISDSAFVSNPRARLNFFYQRSKYWDERLNLYPVGKLMEPVQLTLRGRKY